MIVECGSIDEFIECLTDEEIVQKTIRVDVSKIALDNGPEHLSFEIVVQLSAVVRGEDYEFLLKSSFSCGKDYYDETDDKSGTEKANRVKQTLKSYAKEREWRVLPGVINI